MKVALPPSIFKILQDETLTFVGKRKMYVTLVDEGKYFSVIIDLREKRIAKRIVVRKQKAYKLFNSLIETLGRHVHIAGAYEIATFAMKLETLDECLFLIRHSNDVIGLDDIWNVKMQYHFKTFPETYDFKIENESFNKQIKIYFGSNKIEIGSYRAIDDDKKLLFSFVPNANYPGFSR